MQTVFFDLRLKEYFTPALQKLGAQTKAIFGSVDKSIGNTQRNLQQLGQPIKPRFDTSDLERANREAEKLNRNLNNLSGGGRSGGRYTPAFGTIAGGAFVGNIAAQGLNMGLNAFKNIAGNVFNLGMDATAQKAQFEVLAGSKGAPIYKDLTKFIQDTVFGPSLYANARTLMAFGVAPDEVMRDIKMLGDISMGDKNRMDQLTLAFAQTRSAGKLMGQDLLQYIAAGFNPLQEISKKTGQSISVLRDKMSDGAISAKMVTDAFMQATSEGGKFYRMLDKMAETPFGQKEAMMGSIQGAEMIFGESVMGTTKKLFNELKPIVDELPATLAQMKPQIDNIITGTAEMVHWAHEHADSLKTILGLTKVAVEAWGAWKIGTMALTAANWAWTTSLTAGTAEAALSTSAFQLQNSALLEQRALVNALGLSYDQLTAQVTAFTAAEMNAFQAAAANSFNLPINMAAPGFGAGALANGLSIGVTSAVLNVGVMYFVGEALGQLLPTGKDGSRFGLMTAAVPGDLQHYLLSVWEKLLTPNPSFGNINLGDLRKEDFSYLITKKPSATPALTSGLDTSEAIIGGGKKMININFKNIVENLNQYPANKNEAITMSVNDLKVIFNELVEGLRG